MLVFGFEWILWAIRKYGTREMGSKSFTDVGLVVHDNAIMCNEEQVLNKYKQFDNFTGVNPHKLTTYANECMGLVDKFIALGSLPDNKLFKSIDLVKELHDHTEIADLEREKRALSQQRCAILLTPTLTAKQARLKKNAEEFKKNKLEKQKRADQAQIDIARGEMALEQRKVKEVADLKAENERLLRELEESHRLIASLNAKNEAE